MTFYTHAKWYRICRPVRSCSLHTCMCPEKDHSYQACKIKLPLIRKPHDFNASSVMNNQSCAASTLCGMYW